MINHRSSAFPRTSGMKKKKEKKEHEKDGLMKTVAENSFVHGSSSYAIHIK